MDKERKFSNKELLALWFSFAALFICVSSVIMFSSPKHDVDHFNSTISELPIEDISESVDDSHLIGINTATSEELQTIPNIGPKTAELIIEYRNVKGTIMDIDELVAIDGIGDKTVELLKEYCKIN